MADSGTSSNRVFSIPAMFIWLTTLMGLVLSIISILKICSSCSETGLYRIFAMDFGWFGIAFFVAVMLTIALRKRFAWSGWTVVMLLFALAGAESRSIWIQKY